MAAAPTPGTARTSQEPFSISFKGPKSGLSKELCTVYQEILISTE
jgi:hypothetical protein